MPVFSLKNILTAFTLLLQISVVVQESVVEKKFAPEELKSDLEFLFIKFEQIHPNLYHNISKEKVLQLRNDVMTRLQQPLTRTEFAREVIPVVSRLRDGHTFLSFPTQERQAFLKENGKIFPLDVLIQDNRLWITHNYGGDTSIVGAEIILINEKSATEILTSLRGYISAELDFYRDIRLQLAFRRLLWYVFGFDADYQLEFQQQGQAITKTIAGITEQEFYAAYKPVRYKDYALYFKESIPIIDFRSMNNANRFKEFLDSAFNVISTSQAKHLIIDMRNNGGGNSQLGDMLFNYITDKPYRQVVEADIKQNGKIRHVKASMTKPKKVKNDYKGKTYLLTSHITFSSANMFASAFKCYNMGIIIGEETGGVLTAFGDIVSIELPNTKLSAGCSFKKFVHPCNDGTLHGVKPDISITPTPADIINNKDVVLEQTLKIIHTPR